MYYGEIRRRVKVEFTLQLREKLSTTLNEMHRLYTAHRTPVVKKKKVCNSCSMKDICMPAATSRTASDYIAKRLKGDEV